MKKGKMKAKVVIEDEQDDFEDLDEDTGKEKYLLYKILNLEKGADNAAIVSAD